MAARPMDPEGTHHQMRGPSVLWRSMVALAHDQQARIPLAVLFVIGVLAFQRLFVDPVPRVPLLFNWSASLPYRVAWLERGATRLDRGDFVLYAFSGKAVADYPGLAGQPFFKVVAGLPGDPIRVEDRNVFVADHYVGFAKLRTFDGRSLTPVESSVVPAGHYYVRGSGADSFDSRYREAGFVAPAQIVGKVTPWF